MACTALLCHPIPSHLSLRLSPFRRGLCWRHHFGLVSAYSGLSDRPTKSPSVGNTRKGRNPITLTPLIHEIWPHQRMHVTAACLAPVATAAATRTPNCYEAPCSSISEFILDWYQISQVHMHGTHAHAVNAVPRQQWRPAGAMQDTHAVHACWCGSTVVYMRKPKAHEVTQWSAIHRDCYICLPKNRPKKAQIHVPRGTLT